MQAQRQQQQQQQPQAVSQPQITKQQSLILLKNMLRISVSTICYLRQMFPEECFRDIEYGNCKLSQLQCAEIDDNGVTVIKDQNAFLLTQWLERGVFAALNHEYLHTMVFSVFTTHPQTGKDVLLENYEFKIGYPREEEQDDQQHLDDDTTTGKNNNNNRTKPMKSARKKLSEFNSTKKGSSNNVMTVNNVPIHSKDDVKAQANKFIRELIQFTRTLDELPPNRWITISLTYTDKAPLEYEPEYFKAGDDSLRNLVLRVNVPIKVDLGGLRTDDHEFKLRYMGLEKLLFEDRALAPEASEPVNSFLKVQSIINDDDNNNNFNTDTQTTHIPSSMFQAFSKPLLSAVAEDEDIDNSASQVSDDLANLQLNQEAHLQQQANRRRAKKLANGSVVAGPAAGTADSCASDVTMDTEQQESQIVPGTVKLERMHKPPVGERIKAYLSTVASDDARTIPAIHKALTRVSKEAVRLALDELSAVDEIIKDGKFYYLKEEWKSIDSENEDEDSNDATEKASTTKVITATTGDNQHTFPAVVTALVINTNTNNNDDSNKENLPPSDATISMDVVPEHKSDVWEIPASKKRVLDMEATTASVAPSTASGMFNIDAVPDTVLSQLTQDSSTVGPQFKRKKFSTIEKPIELTHVSATPSVASRVPSIAM